LSWLAVVVLVEEMRVVILRGVVLAQEAFYLPQVLQ
jgi:hypothetical protein